MTEPGLYPILIFRWARRSRGGAALGQREDPGLEAARDNLAAAEQNLRHFGL